jgi:hypothetical protein
VNEAVPLTLSEEEGWSRFSGATALLLVGRRSQSGATLAPAIVDDFAATARGHPRPEAMRANTPRVMGLIRALHR